MRAISKRSRHGHAWLRVARNDAPPRHDGSQNGSLRMTAEPDAKLIEQGRKLFAGDWQFFWASPSIETLPPMAGIEVAFAGRSNVGKSSLINALTGRNALARTSHTPGRTQELIFFEGPDDAGFRLVDMPGYGYASAPKAKVASWTALIHKFLQGRSNLARVYVLIDARHGLKEVDLDVLEDARQIGGELSDRADQGRPGKAGRAGADASRDVKAALAKHPAAFPEVLATSSRTGAGMPELRAAMVRLLGGAQLMIEFRAVPHPDHPGRRHGRRRRHPGGGCRPSGRRRAAGAGFIDAAVSRRRRARGRGADRARHRPCPDRSSPPPSALSSRPRCSPAT